MKSYALEVAPAVIHQWASYGYSMDIGQTAREYEPEGKAGKEIGDLFLWLRKLLAL